MKKLIILLLITFTAISCKESKDFLSISGNVKNAETKEIRIVTRDFNKKITLSDDGSFKDTLRIKKGIYALTDGKNRTFLYLDNGYDLKVDIDATDFSITNIKGKGKESNEYILAVIDFSKSEYANPKTYFSLDKDAFNQRIEELKKVNKEISTKKVDTTLVAQVEDDHKRFINYLKQSYESKNAAAVNFAKGNPSPKFTNLENFNGSTTSLDDFKGTYVYIDVWATWCGPCKQQIPFLKKVEEAYHDKNIVFVSLSTDRQNKYKTWRKMVEDYEMGGVQLFAGDDHSFAQAYQINSIPRFILVDPEGNIVDANAPRPSDPNLIALFDSLGI